MNLCTVKGCMNEGRYCRFHLQTEIKPATTIKKVSDKTEDILKKKYMPLARLFIKQHPACQGKLIGCTGKSQTIHHARGRIGELLIDTKFFKALCLSCHQICESHPEMAKKNKLSESRLAK